MLDFIDTHGDLTISDARCRKQLFDQGMLGVSLTSHAFSKQLIKEVALLGSQLCKKFIIVIFDYPERHNWPLTRGCTSARAHCIRCYQISQEKKHGFERAIQLVGLADCVRVVTWELCTKDARYTQNVKLLAGLYDYNPGFREAIIRQVRANLSGKIGAVESLQGRRLTRVEITSLHMYLIEEVAGLLFLQFDLGYLLDIYPGPQMEIMHRIYSGEFPEINKLGHNWQRQGWLTVRHTHSNGDL